MVRPWLLAALLTTGCGDSPCLTDPGGDLCAYHTFKAEPPAKAADAVVAVSAMKDPVVRSTAVQLWLQLHPDVPIPDGVSLCNTLQEGEKQNCARRVNSPHLHR